MQITRSPYSPPTLPARASGVTDQVKMGEMNHADNRADVDHITEDGVSYVDNDLTVPQKPTSLRAKLATAACAGAAGWTLANIAGHVAGAGGLGAGVALGAGCVGAAVAAWMASDLGSGLFHWTVDNYPTKDTPVIGGTAAAFQIHHHRTQDLHDGSFWENCASAGQVMWAPLAAVAAVNPHPMLQAAALSMLAGGWLAQGSHRWTHADKHHPAPKIAGLLQKLHITQSPEDHRVHHRMPWSTNYCIVNGANNGWMSKLDVFPRLEKLVYDVTGRKPHSWNDPGVEAYSRASWGSRAERDEARSRLLAHQDENRKVFVAKAKEEYADLKVHLGLSDRGKS